MTGFEKSFLACTIVNIYLKCCMLGRENKCLDAIHHNSESLCITAEWIHN